MIPADNVSSFSIDHTDLKSGIYIAREGKTFRTFDIRVTSPNIEPAMTPGAAHSMEHLLATWFRNSNIKEHVIAVDGMMCLTGFYLILDYPADVYKVREVTIQALQWIIRQTEVPATTAQTCGNYKLHNLEECKEFAMTYLDRLTKDFRHTYTKIKVTTSEGKVFADS